MLAPFIGKAQKKPSKLNKMLVVQRAKLGDMVCTTPLFHALKRFNQDIEVYVYGNKINKQVLENNSDIDGYIVDTNSVFRNIHLFRKQAFDCVCIVTPDFFALASAYLAGVRCIIVPQVVGGYSPYETIPYKIMRRFVIVKTHRMGHYAPLEYLRLLEPLGIFTEDTTKHLRFSTKANTKAQELFSQYTDKILVGITLSAGNKIKEWPVARFAEVANYVASKYNALIVIFGSINDSEYAKEMKNSLSKDVQYIDTTGTLSIDELKAIVSKLNLFVSVDTGPIYIAEAFGVPTIDIVGPIDENEQPPRGKYHKIVVTKREKAMLHVMNARVYNKKEAKRQVESISVNMVIDVYNTLINNLKSK